MAFQLFPSFSFNESNVGPRPVRSVALDRVGMAGVFNYGPAGAAIADPNSSKKLYGFDEAVGSAHLQAVLDQGVGDVLISRVLAPARFAELDVTLSGTVAGAGSVTVSVQEGFDTGTVTLTGTFADTETITVTIGGTAVVTTLTSDTAASVTTAAAAVAAAITANATAAAKVTATSALGVVTLTSKDATAYSLTTSDTATSGTSTASGAALAFSATDTSVSTTNGQTASALATAIVNAMADVDDLPFVLTVGDGNSGTTGKLNIKSTDGGVAGNSGRKIKFTLVTSTGITFSAGTSTALTALAGGIDAASRATATLVDEDDLDTLALTAVSYGTASNTVLKATVTASLTAGKFNLVLQDTTRGLTEYYSEVDLTDVYDEDKLSALRNSHLATGVVLSSAKVPVAAVTNFTGGDNGDATLIDDDFIDAIDAMAAVQCTIIICPGLKPAGIDQDAINAVLVAQAETADTDMGELLGLRIAVISAPKGTGVNDIAGLRTGSKIPDSDRCVMVVGWGTSARVAKFKRFGIDGAALYAGLLVRVRHHISPAAKSSAPAVQGITEIDTPVGVAAQNEITRNRLDAIVVARSGAFRILNGRTTSTDPAWYWVCYRRMTDKIRTDIFVNMEYIASEPMNPTQDTDIERAIDGYLQGLVDNNELNGYDPTVSDDSNNAEASRDAGERYVDIGIEYVPPNDKTQFNLNRVSRATIRIV